MAPTWTQLSAIGLLLFCVIGTLAEDFYERDERSPLARSAMVRFGKRSPMSRSAMVRFGRSALDRQSLVRFGKRSSLNRSSMVRFGKRDPMSRSTMVRFGKRSMYDEELMLFLGTVGSLYVGGKIAQHCANFLEENEIFVHEDDDDED
ncbi:Essential MCU regulator, mitochondrial [Aphelenchoides besseyi]|nr:Essential MCU regulator, mitochondrial [Aphelenchoides besseyi]